MTLEGRIGQCSTEASFMSELRGKQQLLSVIEERASSMPAMVIAQKKRPVATKKKLQHI